MDGVKYQIESNLRGREVYVLFQTPGGLGVTRPKLTGKVMQFTPSFYNDKL